MCARGGKQPKAETAQHLNGLLIADLRCPDAHAHLGNLVFDRQPEAAICAACELGMQPYRFGEFPHKRVVHPQTSIDLADIATARRLA